MRDFKTEKGKPVQIASDTHQRLKDRARNQGRKISLEADHAIRLYLETMELQDQEPKRRRFVDLLRRTL